MAEAGTSTSALLLILAATASSASYVSVVYTLQGRYEVKSEPTPEAVAQANLTERYYETGWDFLEIRTNKDYPDSIQAYAAGLAEAALTRDRIIMHWNNTVSGYCQWQGQKMCDKLNQFYRTNENWVRAKVTSHRATDAYWHQVGLVMEQLDGLIAGTNLQPVIPSDPGILWMNLAGDLEDLQTALRDPTELPDDGSRVLGSGHCSALIKLLPDNSDLYTSQVTWSSFQSMLRIQKRYIFGYHQTSSPDSGTIPGYMSTFSSYPGIIGSQDDFYILSSGLVAQETTIGNSNNDLWKNIKPQGAVLEWVRSIVANNLATDGDLWTRIFSQYNSGTYNNQWMIVDYKMFKRGTEPQTGLLHVLEQIPGHIASADVTDVLLKQGYWPSYNSPYFTSIFNMSGIQPLVDKFGDWFSYERTPRARIFRRDQSKVKDVASMTRLMRYNNFKHDPLSACNCTPPFSGENAISARCDLNPANGTYPFGALGHRDHGATDMKLTTDHMMRNMQLLAIAGPTYDDQPPFQWSKSDFEKTTPHQGHPDIFKFEPVLWRWNWH